MSLPEHCDPPVPWVGMSEGQIRARRRMLGLLIHMEARDARDADARGDLYALGYHQARLADLRARLRELDGEGGAQ